MARSSTVGSRPSVASGPIHLTSVLDSAPERELPILPANASESKGSLLPGWWPMLVLVVVVAIGGGWLGKRNAAVAKHTAISTVDDDDKLGLGEGEEEGTSGEEEGEEEGEVEHEQDNEEEGEEEGRGEEEKELKEEDKSNRRYGSGRAEKKDDTSDEDSEDEQGERTAPPGCIAKPQTKDPKQLATRTRADPAARRGAYVNDVELGHRHGWDQNAGRRDGSIERGPSTKRTSAPPPPVPHLDKREGHRRDEPRRGSRTSGMMARGATTTSGATVSSLGATAAGAGRAQSKSAVVCDFD